MQRFYLFLFTLALLAPLPRAVGQDGKRTHDVTIDDYFTLASIPVSTVPVRYNAVRSNHLSMNPPMNPQSLEEALQGSKSPVERLRNSQIGPYAFPVVRPEFTNWRDEQRSWKESCALLDQSHHMADLYLDGPDALKVLSDLGINSFKTFKVNQAKQFVAFLSAGEGRVRALSRGGRRAHLGCGDRSSTRVRRRLRRSRRGRVSARQRAISVGVRSLADSGRARRSLRLRATLSGVIAA